MLPRVKKTSQWMKGRDREVRRMETLMSEGLGKIKPTDLLRLSKETETDRTNQEFLCREQYPPDGHVDISGGCRDTSGPKCSQP
jgi:hypothetical protein